VKSKKNLNNFSELGNRVRELREGRGLQQKDLASILGYQNNTSVSKIELGIKPPSADDFIKLAQAFNVDLHWLITGQESPNVDEWKKDYNGLLDLIAKYVLRVTSKLLEERGKLWDDLCFAELEVADGKIDVGHVKLLKEEIARVESEIADVAEDQGYIKEALALKRSDHAR
jgi:transcriptional regulator with XRE-family HTH domain